MKRYAVLKTCKIYKSVIPYLKSIRSRFKNDDILKNTLNVYSALEMTVEKSFRRK
jgi:hypothetical protein